MFMKLHFICTGTKQDYIGWRIRYWHKICSATYITAACKYRHRVLFAWSECHSDSQI